MRPAANAAEVFHRHYIPEPNSGCWLWVSSALPKGYGTFSFRGRTYRAPRFSWEHHHGEIPGDLWVLHRCDTPACVNPDHLFLGTNQDNVDDKVRKGRASSTPQPGESNGFAKLTTDAVRKIRASKKPGTQLAQRFGVSSATISRVRNYRLWRHV